MASLLFEVSAINPLVFSLAAALLIVVAMAASWLPARTYCRIRRSYTGVADRVGAHMDWMWWLSRMMGLPGE
jgi:hypothetical protein